MIRTSERQGKALCVWVCVCVRVRASKCVWVLEKRYWMTLCVCVRCFAFGSSSLLPWWMTTINPPPVMWRAEASHSWRQIKACLCIHMSLLPRQSVKLWLFMGFYFLLLLRDKIIIRWKQKQCTFLCIIVPAGFSHTGGEVNIMKSNWAICDRKLKADNVTVAKAGCVLKQHFLTLIIKTGTRLLVLARAKRHLKSVWGFGKVLDDFCLLICL